LQGSTFGRVVRVDSAMALFFDTGSQSLVTLGYVGPDTLKVTQLDPVTLMVQCIYQLELASAWVLNAPRLSDGFLVLIGADEPFVGTVFTIDLRRKEVYEQEPPTDESKPRRRKVLGAIVAERVHTASGSAAIGAERRGSLASGSLGHGEDCVASFREDHMPSASSTLIQV
jgi:hypothetical protein